MRTETDVAQVGQVAAAVAAGFESRKIFTKQGEIFEPFNNDVFDADTAPDATPEDIAEFDAETKVFH